MEATTEYEKHLGKHFYEAVWRTDHTSPMGCCDRIPFENSFSISCPGMLSVTKWQKPQLLSFLHK